MHFAREQCGVTQLCVNYVALVKALKNYCLNFVFQQMWVFDEDVGMNFRDVTFVPGLYKIFDEILGML